MNPRTRILLILVGALFLLWLGDSSYRSLVEEPARLRERELAKLKKEIATARKTAKRETIISHQIKVLSQASLPSTPDLARSSYQEWLLTLLKELDFQQTSVDAGAPTPLTIKDSVTKKLKEYGHRFAFSIRGRGSLPQVTQLLFHFHRSPHLHKIRSISLTPAAGGQMLDVSLAIEALSLKTCERTGELATGESSRLLTTNLQDYQIIARRNLFAADGNAALRQATLTAVTFDKAGVPGAWFSVGEETQKVQCGDQITVAAHQIEILDIQPQRVVIDMDGLVFALPLGKSIHEVVAGDMQDEPLPTGALPAGPARSDRQPGDTHPAPGSPSDAQQPSASDARLMTATPRQ